MDIVELDFTEPSDIERLLRLLSAYLRTPNGGGGPLPEEIEERLQADLPRYGNLAAYVAQRQRKPAGVVLGCFGLFLFSAKPYANIQFVFVRPEFQGQGIAKRLMHAFEEKARGMGCGRITLEVRESNQAAKALYRGLEYRRGSFGPNDEALEFWERTLD